MPQLSLLPYLYSLSLTHTSISCISHHTSISPLSHLCLSLMYQLLFSLSPVPHISYLSLPPLYHHYPLSLISVQSHISSCLSPISPLSLVLPLSHTSLSPLSGHTALLSLNVLISLTPMSSLAFISLLASRLPLTSLSFISLLLHLSLLSTITPISSLTNNI